MLTEIFQEDIVRNLSLAGNILKLCPVTDDYQSVVVDATTFAETQSSCDRQIETQHDKESEHWEHPKPQPTQNVNQHAE